MKTKKYYEQKLWEHLCTPYWNGEKPTIKFLKREQREDSIYYIFLINGQEISYSGLIF